MELQVGNSAEAFHVILCEERFDAFLAPEFNDKMKVFIAEGKNRIVLDLSQVDFVDSTALGVIIKALKMAKETDPENGNIELCGVNKKVMSLLQLTRMDRVFTIHSVCPHVTTE